MSLKRRIGSKRNAWNGSFGSGALFNRQGRTYCVLSHQEMIGDVITSGTAGAFDNQGIWLLNPGNADTFPWLSQIAQAFEEFKFLHLCFHFRSTSSDALSSANTALGVVIGATDYNILHTPFFSKQQMDNFEGAMSGKSSLSWSYPVDCRRHANVLEKYFISSSRQSPPATSPDPRLYYPGGFQIATSGFQGTNVNIGELWVSYRVVLTKPAMSVNVSPGGGALFWAAEASTSTNPAITGVSAGKVYGTQTGYTFTNPATGNSIVSALIPHSASTFVRAAAFPTDNRLVFYNEFANQYQQFGLFVEHCWQGTGLTTNTSNGFSGLSGLTTMNPTTLGVGQGTFDSQWNSSSSGAATVVSIWSFMQFSFSTANTNQYQVSSGLFSAFSTIVSSSAFVVWLPPAFTQTITLMGEDGVARLRTSVRAAQADLERSRYAEAEGKEFERKYEAGEELDLRPRKQKVARFDTSDVDPAVAALRAVRDPAERQARMEKLMEELEAMAEEEEGFNEFEDNRPEHEIDAEADEKADDWMDFEEEEEPVQLQKPNKRVVRRRIEAPAGSEQQTSRSRSASREPTRTAMSDIGDGKDEKKLTGSSSSAAPTCKLCTRAAVRMGLCNECRAELLELPAAASKSPARAAD
jgi:hypothetical protein